MASMIATSTHLPLAIVAMWDDITLDDVERMRLFYEDLHGQKTRFATLVDGRRVNTPSAAIRRALADMTKTFEGRARQNTVCVATVVDGKVLVGVLTALRWFIKDEQPFSYHATAHAALKWCEAHLARERLEVQRPGRGLVEKLDMATNEQLTALFGDG